MGENLLLMWAVFATIVAMVASINWIVQSRKTADANGRAAAASNEKAQLEIKVAALAENERSSGQTVAKLNEDLKEQRQLGIDCASHSARLDEKRLELESKIATLQNDAVQQQEAFKSIASEALRQCLNEFKTERDDAKTVLVDPLKNAVKEFQNKIETLASEEKGDRGIFKSHIDSLTTLNRELQKETANLVLALTSNNKAKGDWGEHVLNRILETAGLQPDKDYVVQQLVRGEDGSPSKKPDVVIKLPQNKSLVVDSKVSLSDYFRYIKATSDDDRTAAAKAHRRAVRQRIKELSGKDYKALDNIGSPDFVVMFIPNEPAFLLAMEDSDDLWQQAWESHVLLVCPSTLMFAMRLVAQLWAQQRRQDNVEAIGKQAGKIYTAVSRLTEEYAKVVSEIKNVAEASKKVEGAVTDVIVESRKFDALGVTPDKKLNATVLKKLVPTVIPDA